MARELALFPLQIVVFPGEAVNLHIFEPRYRQLITDCQTQGITFGIPSYQDGRVQEYGTELQLVDIVKTYDRGEMDVQTEALGLFRIQEFYPKLGDRLYAGGLVEDIAHDTDEDPVLNGEILYLARELFDRMKINKDLPNDVLDFQSYDIAHHVGFNTEEEYEFLLQLRSADRQQMLLQQLRRVIPVVKEMENLRERAKLNGHFKNLLPPTF